MMEFIPELKVVANGVELGAAVFKALLAIEVSGSFKSAAALAGVPYATLWNLVARAERALGVRLVEASRRGGTRLTDRGREVLRVYMAEAAGRGIILGLTDFIYAGSHDPVVEEALRGHEAYFVGSMQGFLLVAAGLAHFGGVHLGDNLSFTAAYGPHLCLVGGFYREIGVAARRPVGRLRDLAEMRLVNRPPGAGTRVRIDRLLEELGVPPGEAPGYFNVARTHEEAAAKVAAGEGDYTVTCRYAAEKYGLHFIKLADEEFDFVCRPEACRKTVEFVKSLRLGPGYAAKRNMAEIICRGH